MLCRLAEQEPVDVSFLPDYVHEFPIGYRKGKVTYKLGNLSFDLPGHYLYFEEEDSRGYYDGVEENWHVVRTLAYSIPEDKVNYLEDNENVLVEEKFFNNGKCRLYDLGGEEDGSDSEYVCQCQIITEHQFTLLQSRVKEKEKLWLSLQTLSNI